MLKSILGTNCDVDRMVPWLQHGPVRVPLFSPKPCTICWCTGQPSFCLPFGFYFWVSRLFSLIFCLAFVLFLRQGRVFVGSSVVVPPVFPFLSPCLPCPFVFCLFVFFLSLLLLLHLLRVHSCWGFVCTFASFVDFPFFSWRVSREKGFSPFLILIFALGVKVSKCISESFGRSGYIRCRIGKDGGFIRRDRSSIYQGST